MNREKYVLSKLIEEGQVFAPCIWDNFSARAAELSGFRAALVSSAAVAYSLTGMPDIGLLTADEMIEIVARISAASPLALIIDCEGGYGDTPLHAYRTVRRLATAGAKAIMMADQCGNGGVERWLHGSNPYPPAKSSLPRDEWYAKIAASVEAVRGTDCMVIARTGCYGQPLEEAIARCQGAVKLGADMTLICGITTPEQCRAVSEQVPGWKMYPDIISQNGVPDMELSELDRLGFNLVSVHFLEKGALWGMLEYGERVQQDGNTVFPDQHDMGGRGQCGWIEQMKLYVDYQSWLGFEEQCKQEAAQTAKR